jgi:hypothetical protein
VRELEHPDRGEDGVHERREADRERGYEREKLRAREEVGCEWNQTLGGEDRQADVEDRRTERPRRQVLETGVDPQGDGGRPSEEADREELRAQRDLLSGARIIAGLIGACAARVNWAKV